jgi:hypothetical protein
MESTLDFNKALKGLGVYQTGADAFAFSGANKWNHADTDAFGHLPFWPRATVGRMYIYDSTMNRVPASGQIGVNDLASSSQACGAPGTSARVACFDWGLASGYAYGTIPSFRSATLWPTADPDASKLEANVKKWVSFFKRYRQLFAAGNMLHIRRPDSRGYEAVGFVQPGSYSILSGKLLSFNRRASSGRMHQLESSMHSAYVTVDTRGTLALTLNLSSYHLAFFTAVFNPSKEVIQTNVTVPMYYTGLPSGSTVTVALDNVSTGTGGGTTHTVGHEGGGLYDISVPVQMPPASYAVFKIGNSA